MRPEELFNSTCPTNKSNFKKKTPFTSWVDSYFSGGVFFNAPVKGI